MSRFFFSSNNIKQVYWFSHKIFHPAAQKYFWKKKNELTIVWVSMMAHVSGQTNTKWNESKNYLIARRLTCDYCDDTHQNRIISGKIGRCNCMRKPKVSGGKCNVTPNWKRSNKGRVCTGSKRKIKCVYFVRVFRYTHLCRSTPCTQIHIDESQKIYSFV